MVVLDKEFTLFIKNEEIENRINELSVEINRDYKDKNPLIIVLLNGAFIFASDLVKNISIPCQITFVKVASYEGLNSTGKVTEIFGLQEEVRDRNVILLDDIVDSGATIQAMLNKLKEHNPSSIEIITLLLKPEAFKNQFPVKYIGFNIANDFVIGYGLDYHGYGRNTKDIYHLKS